MCEPKTSSKKLLPIFIWLGIVAPLMSFFNVINCQDVVVAVDDYDQIHNPAVLPLVTQLAYSRISNLTSLLSRDIGHRSSFCVKDPETEWNQAFNFSSNLDFLSSCIQKTKGDITKRLCTAAEMKFYFNSFFEGSRSVNFLKPNNNCNLTSWVSGCEPGWACSVGSQQQVDLQNSRDIPARTTSCQACCEGFFCLYLSKNKHIN